MADAIVWSMATTTMQLDSELRDDLAEVARTDYQGVPLAEAVRRLLREHRINRIIARYEELRADPAEWASYRAEARLTDNATVMELTVDSNPPPIRREPGGQVAEAAPVAPGSLGKVPAPVASAMGLVALLQ